LHDIGSLYGYLFLEGIHLHLIVDVFDCQTILKRGALLLESPMEEDPDGMSGNQILEAIPCLAPV
jgi:hypothetical protein